MKEEKVSIIIPVYNSENYIKRCLDSIVNQTYKNVEVIAIDDGSKDKSLNILKEYKTNYSFIKVFSQQNNGVAKTRNKAISLTTGKYVMFIDNDDYIDSNYIEKYVTEIKERKADIVIGGYKRVNEEKVLFKTAPKDSKWAKYIVVAPWAKIYKREVLIKSKAEFLDYGIGEDVYFSLCLYAKNFKITTFNYIGYNWFYNNSSISNTSQKGFKEGIDILVLMNKLWELKEESSNESENIRYYIYRYCIWYLLFSGHEATSEKFISEYDRLYAWLKEKENVNVNMPKGELLKYKLPVRIFTMIIKLKCVKLFSKIYCKG